MYAFDDFGICGGCLFGADLRSVAECAGRNGFSSITLWPSHFDRARAAGLSGSDMRSILADNGVRVSELDPLCTWLPTRVAPGDIAAGFFAHDADDFLRIAEVLGARSINLIQASRDPLPRTEVIDALAAFTERAARNGLVVSLEFMPWSPIGSLSKALELVLAVGSDRCGVNLDLWHHFRSGGTLAALGALDPSSVQAVQLSDVDPTAWPDPLEETAEGRRLPGEGASDSRAVVEALFDAGVRVPINLEVFSSELRAMAPSRAAARIAESVRQLVAQTVVEA